MNVLLVIVAASGLGVFQSDESPASGMYCVPAKEIASTLRQKGIRIPASSGMYVMDVMDNGPADIAGLQRGDVIISIDRRSLTDYKSLELAFDRVGIGKESKIQVKRFNDKGRAETLFLQLTLMPDIEVNKIERESCPLKIVGGRITQNKLGLSEAIIQFRNRRPLKIIAAEFVIECFDSFDEPDALIDSNVVRCGVNEIEAFDSSSGVWDLSLRNATTKATVYVKRVRLENGVEWKGTGKKLDISK